jgi:hypothetical protein
MGAAGGAHSTSLKRSVSMIRFFRAAIVTAMLVRRRTATYRLFILGFVVTALIPGSMLTLVSAIRIRNLEDMSR